MKEKFIEAIHGQTKIKLTFYSKQDGAVLTRLCAPMDFGPSRRAKNKDDRYHLWDYESDGGAHTLSLLPIQIKDMIFTDIAFDPSEFVGWTPNWIIQRDWGRFS